LRISLAASEKLRSRREPTPHGIRNVSIQKGRDHLDLRLVIYPIRSSENKSIAHGVDGMNPSPHENLHDAEIENLCLYDNTILVWFGFFMVFKVLK